MSDGTDNSNRTDAPHDLTGQIAWITGAGSGIGQAAAVAMAGAGMQVVLSGRRRESLEETAHMVRAAGKEPMIEVLDISDAGACEDVARRIEARFGRLDMAVLNAGINIKNRRWDDIDVAGWDDVVNINLNGAFYCCRAVLPIMRKQKSGLIVNVASRSGVRVSKAGAAYTASKHGMVAMSETINLEEGDNGIRACALCPGEVATPILDQRPVAISDAEKAKMIQTQDMAQTILFVARMPARVCINQLVMSPSAHRPGA